MTYYIVFDLESPDSSTPLNLPEIMYISSNTDDLYDFLFRLWDSWGYDTSDIPATLDEWVYEINDNWTEYDIYIKAVDDVGFNI